MSIPCSLDFQTTHLFRMLSLIPTPHPQIHESCQKYTSCSIIYTDHSSYNHTQPKQIIQGPIDIPTQHSLAQHLAQAEGSRSGETCSLRRASPSPRREHKNKCVGNVGSRLSEIPLAWASCLLAQKPQQVAWATIRGENA